MSKEDMVALCAAIEHFVRLDHQAEVREWERRIGVIEEALKGIPTVKSQGALHPGNRQPRAARDLHLGREEAQPDARPGDQRASRRRSADSDRRVSGTGDKGF